MAHEDLFAAYKAAFPNQDSQVGRPTFVNTLKLLTICGNAKAGVSTYYVRIQYMSRTFVQMLWRLLEIDSYVNH
jgi:hypothetical protein